MATNLPPLRYVTVSHLGKYDEQCTTLADALLVINRYKPVLGEWSAIVEADHFGRKVYWSAAKWRMAKQASDKYMGKIICYYEGR